MAVSGVNITTLAERWGIARERARAILNAAGVQRNSYRLYDEARADAVLEAAVDKSMTIGNHLAGRGHDDGAGFSAFDTVAQAKAMAEQARAEKIRLEVDQKRGKLLDREQVLSDARDFAYHLRTGLLGLPSRVCTRLVGKDADAIARILAEEIRDALTELSDISLVLGAPRE